MCEESAEPVCRKERPDGGSSLEGAGGCPSEQQRGLSWAPWVPQKERKTWVNTCLAFPHLPLRTCPLHQPLTKWLGSARPPARPGCGGLPGAGACARARAMQCSSNQGSPSDLWERGRSRCREPSRRSSRSRSRRRSRLSPLRSSTRRARIVAVSRAAAYRGAGIDWNDVAGCLPTRECGRASQAGTRRGAPGAAEGPPKGPPPLQPPPRQLADLLRCRCLCGPSPRRSPLLLRLRPVSRLVLRLRLRRRCGCCCWSRGLLEGEPPPLPGAAASDRGDFLASEATCVGGEGVRVGVVSLAGWWVGGWGLVAATLCRERVRMLGCQPKRKERAAGRVVFGSADQAWACSKHAAAGTRGLSVYEYKCCPHRGQAET